MSEGAQSPLPAIPPGDWQHQLVTGLTIVMTALAAGLVATVVARMAAQRTKKGEAQLVH